MIGPETKLRFYVRACSFEQHDDYVEARLDDESSARELYYLLAPLRACVELWKDGVFVEGRGWESKGWPDWTAKPWTPEAAPTAAGPWVNEKERSPDEWPGPGLDTRAFLVIDGGFGIRTARRAGKNDEQQDGWIVAEMGFVKRVACWARIGRFEI